VLGATGTQQGAGRGGAAADDLDRGFSVEDPEQPVEAVVDVAGRTVAPRLGHLDGRRVAAGILAPEEGGQEPAVEVVPARSLRTSPP
jgi:hypothetical protein